MRFIETISLFLLVLTAQGCDDLIPYETLDMEMSTDLPINEVEDPKTNPICSWYCRLTVPHLDLCACESFNLISGICHVCKMGFHCVSKGPGENSLAGCCPDGKIPCSNRPNKCCEPRADGQPSSCCDDPVTAYNPAQGDCCATSPTIRCCGGECHDTTKQHCCQDGQRPGPPYSYACYDGQSCCGGECALNDRDQCCNDIWSMTKKVCRKEEKCCGKHCCKENQECCNGECFDPLEQECCGVKVCSSKEKCCSDKCFNPSFYKCCPGTWGWFSFLAPTSHDCCAQISCPKGQCVIVDGTGHCQHTADE